MITHWSARDRPGLIFHPRCYHGHLWYFYQYKSYIQNLVMRFNCEWRRCYPIILMSPWRSKFNLATFKFIVVTFPNTGYLKHSAVDFKNFIFAHHFWNTFDYFSDILDRSEHIQYIRNGMTDLSELEEENLWVWHRYRLWNRRLAGLVYIYQDSAWTTRSRWDYCRLLKMVPGTNYYGWRMVAHFRMKRAMMISTTRNR